MLKVLELFCGAGSFSVGLTTENILHEIVGFSDIRESAIDLFCKIHNKKHEENLGDVKSVSGVGLDVDLLVFGSPCQSFTRSGKGDGGIKGSNTKSSLMWESVRIMKECKPKFIIWENVPDAVSKKHKPNFEEYMLELDEMGYSTYWDILNANLLGSAQKRKRLFAVSVRKDIVNPDFEFIKPTITAPKLDTYLETNGDFEYLNQKDTDILILGKDEYGFKIKNATKQGYIYANEGDAIDLAFPTSKTRRGRVQVKSCHTLMRSKSIGTIRNGRISYLTPLEYWRLQEMPENLYHHVLDCNYGKSSAYDVIGGVLNQKHLHILFNSLHVYYPEHFSKNNT